jgi:hypothetical protein
MIGGVPTSGTSVAHRRRWPATVAVVLVLAAQVALPARVSLGPPWLVPLVQLVLLVPLVVANPVLLDEDPQHPALRALALVSAFAVLGVNTVRVVHLLALIAGGTQFAGSDLVRAALVVLLTNVVAVAVVFWELDRGGPQARDPRHPMPEDEPDLLFPQMTLDGYDAWRPAFLDYLFVAFTASTAFSPTDAMPLSRSFKVLFMLASSTALLTVAGVAARAVNLV